MSLTFWGWGITSFATGSRWKVNNRILGMVRNGKGKYAKGLLGFLPDGRGGDTIDGNKEVGGCVQCG